MYRNQQNYSNSQGFNHIRQPDSTLFEDSPDEEQRAPLAIFNREPNYYPRNQDTQYHLNQLPQNNSQGFHQVQRHYPPLHDSTPLPLHNNYPIGSRFIQSEESGGILLTTEGVGGENNETYDENDHRVEGEGENDVEYIIMNLYSKMKNLENKYIDLANFYKQELVKTNRKEDDLQSRAAISPSKSFERSPEVDQSPGKDSPKRNISGHVSERQIINELIEEKKRVILLSPQLLQLEDDMKHMIALKGSQYHNHSQNSPQQLQQSPQKVTEFKTNIPNKEQLKFLNEQLKEAFHEVLENLDSTQKKELQYLSSKQNEMYQLAGKHNLPQQVKTEALGLWYDAKTKISTLMSDLKDHIQTKKTQVENNLVSSKINTAREDSLQEHPEHSKSNNSYTLNSNILEDFKKELTSLKKKQDLHQKNVQRLKNMFRFKDNLIKEDQSKIQMIIRDLKQGIMSSDDYNRKLLSGEKNSQSNLLMSPFERKIQNYQKSAELRKQTNERSGSRGRPVQTSSGMSSGLNFYNYRGDNNPQITSQQTNIENDNNNNRQIRHKLKQFEQAFDDFYSKTNIKNQEQQEFERAIDQNNLEINKFISTLDNQITYHSQINKQSELRNRSRTKENVSASPLPQPTQYNSNNKDQEKKLNDLLRNNEQIYQELRKANEKYLNQRVDNNKLKDENQILQKALEEAQVQIRKLNQNSIETSSSQKQGIRQKSRTNRHDISNPQPGQQQRNTSNNSTQLLRENEDLKKRIKDLEKECFSLTYYQQELQRRGNANDPYARGLQQEIQEMKNKTDNLCLQVQKFMLAMRRLQRAVNNKDKDIQDLKSDFERNKKVLESMVKEIKEKEELKKQQTATNNSLAGAHMQANTHHSMIMTSLDRRDPRFTSQEGSNFQNVPQARNRSQAPHQSNATFNQRQQPYSVTQRQIATEESQSNTSTTAQLPPKKGIIRVKQQQQQQVIQSSNSNRYIDTSDYNQSNQELQQNQFNEQEQFNNLLDEIKNMSEESEKLKKQIEELKQKNEVLLVDNNTLEVKVNQNKANVQKLTQQLKLASERTLKSERIVNEYKEGLYQLENTSNLKPLTIAKLKSELLYKEKELMAQQEPGKQVIGFGKQSLHIQTENTFNQEEFQELQEELIQRIQEKEYEMELQFLDLSGRLGEKEEDLQKVKRMFVEKLRELESSFVELSQDMIESEQVQIENSRKYQQKVIQQKHSKKNSDLEKSIEQTIGRYDEQHDNELEQLVQVNAELQQENNELKTQIKELKKNQQKTIEVENLKIQVEAIQEENERLEQQIEQLNKEQIKDKKLVEQQKKQITQTKNDLQEQIKAKEATIFNYQTQLNEYESQLLEKSSMLKQEQEKRIFFESEFNKKDSQMKKLKDEKTLAEEQRDKLQQKQAELESQIQSLNQEIEYINTLRGGLGSQDNSFEAGNNSQVQVADESEKQKIESDPKEAAYHYLRLMKVTQNELKISQNNNQKLELKSEELKQKYQDLRMEARETASELMNLENQNLELESQNTKLIQELDKIKGSYKVDKEAIRKEIEAQFRERLAFKDTEVEGMTNKLSRLTQANIDITTKCARLEKSNAELYSENEVYRNRIQSLEMELEMTKINSERDSEQLLEQQKSITEEKQQIENKLQRKKTKMEELKNVKAQLEFEISSSSAQDSERNELYRQKQIEMELQKKQELEALEQRLKNDLDQQLKKKDKERLLIVKLQNHLKVLLYKQLEELNSQSQMQMQQMEEMQEEFTSVVEEHQSRLSTLQQKHNQDLASSQDKQRIQYENDLKKKDKERMLINKLQLHVKKQLENQLQTVIKENEDKEREIQMIKQQQLEEIKKLQLRKEEEFKNIENQLRKEHELHDKKTKKERSLVEVLQKKAREAILKQLEEEKVQRQQDQEQSKKKFEDLIKQSEKEKDLLRETSQLKIQTAQHQLQQEYNAQLQQEKEKYLRQQSEVERLKKEQDDLLKSMTEKQDQQSQDLLNQKEREKEAIKIELERQIKEMEEQLKKNEKQTKLLAVLQEKVRADLEKKLEETQREKEEERQKREQDLQKHKEEQDKLVNSLKGKSKEEQEKIKKELELKQQQADQLILEKEEELKKAKEEQERIIEQFNKKKQEESLKSQEKLKEQLEELRKSKDMDIQELQEQIQDKDEIIQINKEKVNQLMQQIKDLKVNHNQELSSLNQQIHSLEESYQIQIKNLESQVQSQSQQIESLKAQLNSQLKLKEQDLTLLKQQHSQLVHQLESESQHQLEQIKKKLEEVHQNELKKKDQEKGLLQKMQDQVTEQIKKQILEKEQQRDEQYQKVKLLESEISEKEKDVLRERNEQLGMIRELNQKLEEQIDINKKLSTQYQQAKQELDMLKKTQLESENKQIQNLSEKLQQAEKQRDDLLVEKKTRDSELSNTKAKLEEKIKEIDAQGKDLEQLYKEMEETQVQAENDKQELKQKLKESQKEKKDLDVQYKVLEAKIANLEQQLNKNELEIQEKQEKLLDQINEKEREFIKSQSLETQLKNMKSQNLAEIEFLQKENEDLKKQIEDLKTSHKGFDNNQSIDDIEHKLGEFNVQLNQLKQQQKELQSQKKLSDSLIENAEKDNSKEIIGELGQDTLQYCKRIKYLEKAWILVNKKDKYYFVEQEQIPFDRLKKIKVQDIEEKHDQLQKKLEDLQRDKDILVKLIQKNKKSNVGDSQSNDDYLQIKSLQIENASLKQENDELKIHNNNLQQITLQSKTKISELQDIIFKLTETDKASDTLNLMVSQNQDLKNKYIEQIEVNRKLELENEQLKKQITEMDYSFARGAGKSFTQMRPEQFDDLNASSIDHQDEVEVALPNDNKAKDYQLKIQKLESEVEEFRSLAEALQIENKSLKTENKDIKSSHSNAGEKHQQAEEALENIKHMKSLFIQFLEQIPTTNQKAESLLPVIFSMMMLSKEEINNLQKVRQQSTEKTVQDNVKKGILGGMFGKKPK